MFVLQARQFAQKFQTVSFGAPRSAQQGTGAESSFVLMQCFALQIGARANNGPSSLTLPMTVGRISGHVIFLAEGHCYRGLGHRPRNS